MNIGDRVQSTDYYASQFPTSIKNNGGQPLKGTVRRVRRDGLLAVKWDNKVSEVIIATAFVEPIAAATRETE